MNHRGGWALIKRSWASWLQYRSFFFVIAFGWMIPPLIYLFVWSTAAESAPIAGMTPPQFVAYYLVLILVNQLTLAQTNWTVGDVIRMGDLNSWLLKPMSPLYNAIATEVAGKVVMMAFVVPVSIVLAIVLRPELNATPRADRAVLRGAEWRVAAALLLGLVAGLPCLLGHARRCAAGAAGCVDLSAGGRRRAGGAAARRAADRSRACCRSTTWSAFRLRC